MSIHRHIQDQLYELHRGELAEKYRYEIEQHLAGCKHCLKASEDIRELVQAVPLPKVKPSEELPENYWSAFSYQVVHRIRSEERPQPVRKISFREYLQSVFVHQKRVLAAVSLGIAVVAVLVLTRQIGSSGDSDTGQVAQLQSEMETPTVQARLGQYFRKSQILMVGLMNMKSENGDRHDLGTEQTVSRELIKEARYLSQQNLDERVLQLVADLEKILIELANIEDVYDLPDIEILRAGIKQENLLFKLRMGDQLFVPPVSEEQNQTFSQKGESL